MRDDRLPPSTAVPLTLALALAVWYVLLLLGSWTILPLIRWVFA